MTNDIDETLGTFMSEDEKQANGITEPESVEISAPQEPKTEETPVDEELSLDDELKIPEEPTEPEMVTPEEDNVDLTDFKPNVSSKSQQQLEDEYGVKMPKEYDGKILTVKSWEFTKPKAKKENGKFVECELTKKSNSKFYTGKLVVRFEEDNLVEYIPTIKYWVNEKDGKEFLNPNISLDKDSTDGYNNYYNALSEVGVLMKRIIAQKSGNRFEIEEKVVNQRIAYMIKEEQRKEFLAFQKQFSDSDLLNSLIGMKVLIKMQEGNYDGSDWHRASLIPQ